MHTDTSPSRSYGLLAGLIVGSVAGAGLALWLTPRAAAELRLRLVRTAARVGAMAIPPCDAMVEHLGDTVQDLARQARHVRDDVADAVVRGAQAVERTATAAKGETPHRFL